jgi:hypothetical protein
MAGGLERSISIVMRIPPVWVEPNYGRQRSIELDRSLCFLIEASPNQTIEWPKISTTLYIQA